jgi:hypothetical protein
MEDSFSDTDKWKDYIDCESWTKKYLVEEIFGNMDAGWASQYFYYTPGNADSKIYAGPVWDYDFSIGNSQAELSIQNPKCFIANRLKIMEIMGSVHTYWYHLLYNNKEFYSSMVDIYKSEVLPALNDIDKDIINLEQEIAPSLIMDQKRWGEDDTDTASETESLKRFLTEHISFLNSAWLDNVNYHTIIVDRDEGKRHLYYCIKAGEKFENQPTQDKIELSDTEALFNKETGEKFDFDQPINEDLELYIKSCDEISSSDKKGLYTNIVHLIKICVKISPIGVIGILLVVLIVIDLKENSRG